MMAETAAVQENFGYIPLSSLIILLVILLTCASRRKKVDAFSAAEQSFENDIKEEYAIMCFPCLKKKPDLKDFEPSEDLTDQFEYIVEKYTIRKVPLLLANTVEDIIERNEELEIAKAPQNQPQLPKDDFLNFQLSHDVFNVQRVPPCIVAANTACPDKKAIKERQKPADILDSMTPISRPPVNNRNYVVIPTKASLRHKDIMMTKREITNQYLNNFSSVFVDNLKDQVPKDPERFPSLSRPYSSAFKNFPISGEKETSPKKVSKKGKSQKVAYAFPFEEGDIKEEGSLKEELFTDSESGQEETTDPFESEFHEGTDQDRDDRDLQEKKSLVLLNESDSIISPTESSAPNPFKMTIKSSMSTIENPNLNDAELLSTSTSYKEDWSNSKTVTYEDIQALDVGYEFNSCEKLGVKPKMTKIHYPIESEKFRESLKLAFGDANKISKKCHSQIDQSVTTKSLRTVTIKPVVTRPALNYASQVIPTVSDNISSKSILEETSFLSNPESQPKLSDVESPPLQEPDSVSSISQGGCSKAQSVTENDLNVIPSETVVDSVTEISKLYDLSLPVSNQREESNVSTDVSDVREQVTRLPKASRSRSFQESTLARREDMAEVKGKNSLPFPNTTKVDILRLEEPETETTCSLYSRESKTSSAVTTGMSSEIDEGKRATLRWKIVIKHHREDESLKKNVNVNKRH